MPEFPRAPDTSVVAEKSAKQVLVTVTRDVRPTSRRGAVYAAALLFALMDVQIGVAKDLPNNFVVHDSPRPLANIQFENGGGEPLSLADFRGKVIVLNVWATWCVPCRKEMPTLDRLQAALGGAELQVVPVSIDRGGIDTIRKFYTEISVLKLGMYVDKSGRMLRDLGAVGLPTTLIVNRGGQEVARIVGPAEWDSAEIVRFLRSFMGEQASTRANVQADQARDAEAKRDESSALQHGLGWLRALFSK